jgi:hypothetical protein
MFYIIKEFVQPKMSLNREFLIWKQRGRGWERERERERRAGGGEKEREGWADEQVSRSAGRHI